jgi:hypothetical protein
MPSLLLARTVYLFVPKPGRFKSEVRRELAARPGVTVLWHGRLVDAGEWRARHWVGPQLNEVDGPLDPYRNFLAEQGSGQRGFYSAMESLATAAQVLLPDSPNVWAEEVVVARVIQLVK